jgi:hypothetical protein
MLLPFSSSCNYFLDLVSALSEPVPDQRNECIIYFVNPHKRRHSPNIVLTLGLNYWIKRKDVQMLLELGLQKMLLWL